MQASTKIVDTLNWRYATKRMTGEKLPSEKLEAILDAIRLSASAYGLQPYKILVISDPEIRKQLSEVGYRQPQITESSELLVFCAYNDISEQHIDDYVALVAETRGVPQNALEGFSKMLKGSLLNRGAEANFSWAARQAYIALGFGLVAAAAEQVDASPMEGFDNAGFDKVLGLAEKGLRSVVLLGLGYRDTATDPLAQSTKVRKSKEDLFIRI